MINLEYCGDETRWLAMSRAVEKQYRFCHKTAWLTSERDPGLPPSPLEVMIYDTGHGMSAIEWPAEAGIRVTRKSYALRALAHSWRKWCRIHYILDPEHFFGDHSDYLLQVLLGEDVGLLQLAPLGASHVANPQWRLIVLEDTGELISADAKTRSGQGLSRLLNTADGLIGQGLRILVLITTNEELEHLHKAVLRPGRCLANAKFGALSQKEARGWLDMHWPHGVEPVKAALSDLYAILNEKNVIGQCSDQRKVVGF